MNAAAPPPSRRDRIPLRWYGVTALALLPSLVVLALNLDMPHLGLLRDDGMYLATAYSLARGGGYRTASLPGAPYHVKYPPLYPAALSLGFLGADDPPERFPYASVLNWAALPVFAILTLRTFAENRFPAALLLTLLCLGFSGASVAAHSILTDLWMTVFALAALLVMSRSARCAGLLAGLAFLTRTAALPLIAALSLEYLLQRRFRDAVVFFLIVLFPVAGWMAWGSAHRGLLTDYNDYFMSTYSDPLAYEMHWEDLPAVLPARAAAVLAGAGRVLVPDALMDKPDFNLLRLCVGILLVACAWSLPRIHKIYLALTLALLTIWP